MARESLAPDHRKHPDRGGYGGDHRPQCGREVDLTALEESRFEDPVHLS
jgi:hypothetical protein